MKKDTSTPNVSRRLRLIRVICVQEEYKLHKEEGITDRYIYRKFILPMFHISESTFIKYMGENAKRELAIIDEYLKQQKEQSSCE